MIFTSRDFPYPQRMGFASGESPPSEWDSPARHFPPFPGGSLLQVNYIHLKGLPLSTVNGIRFRGVPSSKRMVFSSRVFPLHSEWDSLQRIRLVNSELNSHHLRNPLQENGIRTKRDSYQEGHPLQNDWDSHQRVSLFKRMGFASRGSPSPKRMGFASNVGPRCSKRPLSRDSSPRPRYSRDSLFQRVSPMRLSEWYSLQEIFILPNDNV